MKWQDGCPELESARASAQFAASSEPTPLLARARRDRLVAALRLAGRAARLIEDCAPPGIEADREVFAKAIERGSAKVNISTNLKHVFVDSFVGYHRGNPEDYEPLRVIDAQYRACKELFASFIEKFGGKDRAPDYFAKHG